MSCSTLAERRRRTEVKKEEERASKARPNIEDAPDVVTRDDVAHYLRESRPELAPEVLFCG